MVLWQHLGYGQQQFVWVERLHDPARGSSRLALLLLGRESFRRQHQNWLAFHRRLLAHMLNQRDAIHHRHVEIGDDQVHHRGLQLLQRILAVLGLDYIKASLAQREADHLPHRRRVVHNQCSSQCPVPPEAPIPAWSLLPSKQLNVTLARFRFTDAGDFPFFMHRVVAEAFVGSGFNDR